MLKRIANLLLVLYPILNIYCLPFGPDFSLGTYAFLVLFLYLLFSGQLFGSNAELPKGFVLFWVYVGLLWYFENLSTIKVSTLLPGGLNFVLWVLMFIVFIKQFDIDTFRKYYRVAFVICSLLLFVQEILRITSSFRLILLLPLPLVDGLPIELLYTIQSNLDRSCSVFREPSHFAVFALPLLAIELFYEKRDIWLTKESIFILISLFVLRSGNGFIGAILLLGIRTIVYLSTASGPKRFLTLFLLIPLSVYCVSEYVETDSGASVIARYDNLGTTEDSTSYDRLIRGFDLFNRLPIENKLIGIPDNEIGQYIQSAGMASSFMINTADDNKADTYLNGIQTILVYLGFFGLVLYLSVLLRLMSNNTILGKSMISLFIVLMFMGNNYMSFLMLITMIIGTKEKFSYENSICGS